MIPFRAARPAWSGLTMLPRFSLSPQADDAAMPSACPVCVGDRPSARAAAAAAPTVPIVDVQCHPRS